MADLCSSCNQIVEDLVSHSCTGDGASSAPLTLATTMPDTANAGGEPAASDEAYVAPTADPLIGSVVDSKYKIERLIGHGGMATVYKAVHLALNREVAIKFLAFNRSTDPTSLRRFRQEGKAVSNLSHPNIVGMHDLGLTPSGQPYLVMDYISGTNLAQFIEEKGFLAVHEAIGVFRQVCAGLAHAHDRGIVHRDIKPSNIMLSTDASDDKTPHVRIFDFGIAKLLLDGDSGNKLTQTGEIFGSPLYMSPEQCQGFEADCRSDIYSLGCVLYEALAGEPPLCGSNPLQTLSMHITQEPQSILASRPDLNLPQEVDALISKALAKNPRDRYQSAKDLKFDLELLLNAKPAPTKLPTIVAATNQPVRIQRILFRLTKNVPALVSMAVAAVSALIGCILIVLKVPIVLSILLFEFGFVALYVAIILSIVTKTRSDDRDALDLIPQHLKPLNRLLARNLTAGESTANQQMMPVSLGTEIMDGEGLSYVAALSSSMREHNPHALLVGTRGSGKTRMMAQAIETDCVCRRTSVIVIDQAGDLTDLIGGRSAIEFLSQNDQLTLIDTLKGECKAAFNPLKLTELDLVSRAEIIVSGFCASHLYLPAKARRWSTQTSEILRFAVLVIDLSARSLKDLLPFLTDREFRQQLIELAEINQYELPTNYFSDCRRVFEQALASEQWDKHICPITEVWLPALSHPSVHALLFADKDNLDLGKVLRSREALIVRLGSREATAGSDLIGSFVVAAVLKYAQHDYASARKLDPCMLYIDGCDGILDHVLLSQIVSQHNEHLKIGLMASIRSIERLPANCRDILLARIGMLCAFNLARPDAGIVARYLIPAENIYSGSADTNFRTMQNTVERLMNQKPRQYFCRIREATAGVFQFEAPFYNV